MDRGTLAITSMARAGFSFVFLDQMYGTLDWSDVHYMAAAARLAGITSVVRIQNYPWRTGETDRRILADAARASALGADGVRCSVSGAEDVRQLSTVASDWHRVPMLPTSAEDFAATQSKAEKDLILMPIIESLAALDELDEIMAIDAVNSVMISGTDLPRELGIPMQYEHPKVWAYLDRAVELGVKHGVAVGFNTGYVFRGVDETAERVGRLRSHGVNFILVQTLDHIVYSYVSSLLDRVGHGDENSSSPA
jgi:2-keto-3-deoxy-L-rhamnonate aldolase RhmA